jgi:hypothetical protein
MQRSGTCFLHAPIVLAHYLNVAWSNKASFDHVDIAKFLDLPEADFYKECYLEGTGGNSLDVLLLITGADIHTDLKIFKLPSSEDVVPFVAVTDLLVDCFHKYGPALIRSMRIEDDFCKNDIFSYDLKQSTTYNFRKPNGQERKHAMVLIGHRKGLSKSLAESSLDRFCAAKNGQHVFLLQNSWTKKPFVQVSAEYLALCMPEIIFFRKKPNIEPKKWPLCKSNLGDFDVGDCSDDLEVPESYR